MTYPIDTMHILTTHSIDAMHHIIGMITAPKNDGGLTCLGRFAGTLPVDMQLGQLISYGIALGVGTEGTYHLLPLHLPLT